MKHERGYFSAKDNRKFILEILRLYYYNKSYKK